jgi:GTPase SAR1 family protein
MVYLGLLGGINVGKTSILKMFVDYVEKNKVNKLEGGIKCGIVSQDFVGESNVVEPDGTNLTITISPNKVVFKELESKANHTLFAPGGHRERMVVKMGIITVSRIAKSIVAIFALDRPLKEQFDFYNDVRFFPRTVNVCFNKCDKISADKLDAELKNFEGEIVEFFAKKKITVNKFYRTCARSMENFESYNDNVAKMILDIATSQK